MSWISLHNHSQYSILDSTLSPKQIIAKAKQYEMASVAITDSGNMYGAVDFYKACRLNGIKPIIGCEMGIAPFSRKEKKRMGNYPIAFSCILLVKNAQGYQNLCKLSSLGFLEGFYYRPRIDKELLSQYKEGLICLSGCVSSSFSYFLKMQAEDQLMEELQWYRELFKEDFYFELQNHVAQATEEWKEIWVRQKYDEYIQQQQMTNQAFLQYSQQYSIPCVVTNDVHYLDPEDWKAHEILLNIQSGETLEIWQRDQRGNPISLIPNPKRKIYSSREHYFKSPEQMQELFATHPDALETSREIAEKCAFEFDFQKKHYPVFIPPDLDNSSLGKTQRKKLVEKYLYDLCLQAIESRYSKDVLAKVQKNYPDQDPMEVVKKRMEYEFEIISSKGMCDYLLIVYDFIHWAKERNIPVGPGRGSAAGSILSYLIGITDIEPLQFQLFFERFINPERISYPDIDVDICMERRQEVIDYTIQKYGKDYVAQIITFGTMKAKMALRDVGRVLNVALSKVNMIAKLVPEDPNMTLEKALKLDPELKAIYERDEEAKKVIDMAKKIEGSIRNTSTHAAGVIISATPITDNVPVCIAKDADMIVTQYAMKPVESVGMLKIDFLGLKTLTSIQRAVNAIRQNHNIDIDWTHLSLDDTQTYKLLNQGKTQGLFQLESTGMQELARQLHIDRFEEIIAVGALHRPGPMDMIPSFINRKHKKEEIEIDHEEMKDILAETYGVMVYQEQVMQIASRLAGYSLGEGDVLRKAMGKKDKAEMDRQREKFISGAKQKNISEEIAVRIFDKIEKFASYGFNKSHATAYAYLSYVTAYLKANYTKEWMAALMTSDRDDLTKVAKHIHECRSMNIAILPPDINEASTEFVATKKGIRFAMSGIKGVGQAVVEAVIEERERNQHFISLYDFVKRVDTSKVGKKNIELLIDAGAFDSMGWTRDAMRLSVEAMHEVAAREQKEKQKGVMNLFALMEEDKQFQTPPKVVTSSSSLEILQKEKELLGFYLTAHPMDNFLQLIKRLFCLSIKDLKRMEHDAVCRTAFIVENVKVKIASKSQRKFAILTVSDGEMTAEIPIWPELFDEKNFLLKDNQLLFAIVQIDRKDAGFRLQCHWLDDLTTMDEIKIKKSDEVYDQIKNVMVRRRNMIRSDKSSFKTSTVSRMKKCKLRVNAEEVRFSHILQIKKILRKYSGPIPVEMEFIADSQKISTLVLNSTYGVCQSQDLKKELKDIDGLCDLKFI